MSGQQRPTQQQDVDMDTQNAINASMMSQNQLTKQKTEDD
jgi:hypothetical protein